MPVRRHGKCVILVFHNLLLLNKIILQLLNVLLYPLIEFRIYSHHPFHLRIDLLILQGSNGLIDVVHLTFLRPDLPLAINLE